MTELWVEKYKPQKIDDLILPADIKTKVRKWIYEFKKKKPNAYNCLFLYGPPGIGKTTMAHVVLKEYGYNVHDLDSSENRTSKYIRESLHDILYKKNVMNLMTQKKKETGIIMDEIDGLSIGERGGLSEFIKIILPKKKDIKQGKNYEYRYLNYVPFICITNTMDKKLNDIKTKTCFIHLKKPSLYNLEKMAVKILKNEKINYDYSKLKELIKKSQLDFRKLITLLQYTYGSSNIIESTEPLGVKNIEYTTYDSCLKMLNKYNTIDNTMEIYEANKSLISMLLYENFIHFVLKNKKSNDDKKLDAIKTIYSNFSESDEFDYNIYITQQWDLYNYDCVMKCSKTSYIVNQLENFSVNKTNTIQFSTLLNKTSFEFLNLKSTSQIEHDILKHSESIDTTDLYTLTQHFKPSEITDLINISKEELSKLKKILDK